MSITEPTSPFKVGSVAAVSQDCIEATIDKIHRSPAKLAIAITGGGSSIVSALLARSGASNTLLSALVPYSANALSDFLQCTPKKSCSANTARLMSQNALKQALKSEDGLQQKEMLVFGLGITAAIATGRDRRGSDQCYISIMSPTICFDFHLSFKKDLTRPEQELLCLQGGITAISHAMNIALENTNTTHLNYEQYEIPKSWQGLLFGADKLIEFTNDEPVTIFPGAFNPIHAGHEKMVLVAEQIFSRPVIFEISITNVDKAPLDSHGMLERKKLLNSKAVIFTKAATFLEKSRLMPGANFIVGIDTIERIADPKYYQYKLQKRDAALAEIIANRHRFLVFGRLSKGLYRDLSNLDLPPGLRAICQAVPEQTFREDISSTEIRLATDKV